MTLEMPSTIKNTIRRSVSASRAWHGRTLSVGTLYPMPNDFMRRLDLDVPLGGSNKQDEGWPIAMPREPGTNANAARSHFEQKSAS
jgi:hypothetical protein